MQLALAPQLEVLSATVLGELLILALSFWFFVFWADVSQTPYRDYSIPLFFPCRVPHLLLWRPHIAL